MIRRLMRSLSCLSFGIIMSTSTSVILAYTQSSPITIRPRTFTTSNLKPVINPCSKISSTACLKPFQRCHSPIIGRFAEYADSTISKSSFPSSFRNTTDDVTLTDYILSQAEGLLEDEKLMEELTEGFIGKKEKEINDPNSWVEVEENASIFIETMTDLKHASEEEEEEEGDAKVGQVETTNTKNLDSQSGVLRIIKFSVPAIGLWLCGPILSLIDTASVGLFAGTAQQAALSPAVVVTDYAVYLLAFLYTGTTNQVAAAAAFLPELKRNPETPLEDDPREALLSSLQLSARIGMILGIFVFSMAPRLLLTITGSSPPAVVRNPAIAYIRIRALGAPAAALLGSAQSACLGLKDVWGPLLVLAAAAVVNFLGDIILVPLKFKGVGGAAGAAWATVLSQYVAVVFFLSWLKGTKVEWLSKVLNGFSNFLKKESGSDGGLLHIRPRRQVQFKQTNLIKKLSQSTNISKPDTSSSSTKNPNSFSTRSFLASYKNFRRRDAFLCNPSRARSLRFAPYFIPVLTTTFGRLSMFFSMAHVVSSTMGTIAMASQQIVMSLFDALCPISDFISLTAQSFVPTELGKKDDDGSLRTMTLDFLKAGTCFGLVGSMLALLIPLISGFFTTDKAVVAGVNGVTPFLAAWFLLQSPLLASEGILLGRRDLNVMSKGYGVYFLLVPALFLRVKRAIIQGSQLGIESLWAIMLGYQLSRTVLWVSRALWLSRSREKKSEL